MRIGGRFMKRPYGADGRQGAGWRATKGRPYGADGAFARIWRATKGRPYGADGASARIGGEQAPRVGRDAHIAPRITCAWIGGRFMKRPYGADETLARIGGGQAPRVGRDAHIAPRITRAWAKSGRPKVAPTARTGHRRGSE